MFKSSLEVRLKDGLIVERCALSTHTNKDRRYAIYVPVNGMYKKMVRNLLYSELPRYLGVIREAL